MSTLNKAVKEVFVLPLNTQAFINTEIMPEIEGMNNAVIKKDEFLFNASELVAEVFTNAEVFDVAFWNAVFAFIEAQAISKFKIAESTAKNYSKDIVAFLKLRTPVIVKPASTEKDAVRKQNKKVETQKLLDDNSHLTNDDLANEIKSLIGKPDKSSTLRFKEVSSVVKLRNDDIANEKKEQERKDKADFKQKWTDDLKAVYNNEYEFAQYLHANLDNYRKAFLKSK
jgi:hypothetical protein